MHETDDQLSPASEGSGPLLQRDYWAFVDSPRVKASQMGAILADKLPELAPAGYVHFRPTHGRGPLAEGDDVEVGIRFAGTFHVRVIHRDDHSLTFATVRGHPEAGRITFGAYPSHQGHLIVHVRSCARSSSRLQRLGFRIAGESVQTSTWGELVKTVAATVGEGVAGVVHEETRELPADRAEDEQLSGPTFTARGD